MATNIINQNLDQFGLQYGEGLNPYAPDVQIDNMPTNRGYTNFDDQEVGIINTDIGNQRAELTESQTDFIDKNKSNLNRGFKDPSYVFDAINNPNLNYLEKNTFNPLKDPQEPTTTKEFNDYLNKIGIDPQYRMPNNKPQASLNNGIMENIGNFFFTPAAAAESEIRPNNNLNSFGLNAPQFSITDMLQQDVNKDIYNGYRPEQPRSFRSMTQNQNVYEPEQASILEKGKDFFNQGKDLASSGILKAGKTGMNLFNLVKNNNPIGFLTSGIGNLFGGLDQFDTLPIEDQEFILEQAGGNRPSKDAFGINRRSAFGNYAQYVRDKGIFAKGKRGEYYRNISGLDQALMDTLDREQKAKAAYEQQIKDAANEASRNAARARSITAGYGGSDDSRGATGPTASGAGMGVGGGYASDYQGADGGSVPTGLASMFVEKR